VAFGVLTHKGDFGERSTRVEGKLTKEYDLLRNMLVTHEGVFLVCSSLGKIFLFLHGLLGNL